MSITKFFLEFKNGFDDIQDGFLDYKIWLRISYYETIQKYRRTIIGPFWMTLTFVVMIGGMGPLYAQLFGKDINAYFVYITIGFITWGFIMNSINESCTSFITSDGYILQQNVNFSVFIYKTIARNFITFLHGFPLFFIVKLLLGSEISISALILPFTFILLLINLFFIGLIVAILSTRYRDIQQLVASTLTILFFISPIIWETRGIDHWIVDINPMVYFLDLVRSPLNYNQVPFKSIYFSLVFSIFSGFLSVFLIGRYRNKIAYWI